LNAIGGAKNLKVLNLGHNQLSHLSPEIETCKKLKELHLNDNTLRFLPSVLGCLKKLKTIHLENNQLSIDSVPESVRNLPDFQLGIQTLPPPPPLPTVEEVARLTLTPRGRDHVFKRHSIHGRLPGESEGKSLFPANWGGDKIEEAVRFVVDDQAEGWIEKKKEKDHRPRFTKVGEYEGVKIKVVKELKHGKERIVTAYPKY
jgi:hypothetical protein